MKDSSRGVGSTRAVAALLGITGQVIMAAAICACGFLAPALAQTDPQCGTVLPHPPEVSVPPAPPDSTPPLLPPPGVPKIPDGDDIILYLHGGPGSRLEEASDLVAPLLAAGQAAKRQFTFVAFDQPSQGYTEQQDPLCVAQPHSSGNDIYPLVQFNEDFVVAFVDALNKVVPIENRNIFIIGGSTGGMLALRMGHRSEPWIKKVVAWNPASVWTTYSHNLIKGIALNKGFERAADPEGPTSRGGFFDQAFGPLKAESPLPKDTLQGQPNPEEWYRGNRECYPSNVTTQPPFWREWKCKWEYIGAGRMEMQEVYSDTFRRWHWRFGAEELLFSFFNDSWTGPANDAGDAKAVYHSIQTPTLLLASDDDDWNVGYVPADKVAKFGGAIGVGGGAGIGAVVGAIVEGPWGLIAGAIVGGAVGAPVGGAAGTAKGALYFNWQNRYTQTVTMARRMQTPLIIFENTGHSIHNERPQVLATEIATFVSGATLPSYVDGKIDETCSSDFTPWGSLVFATPSLDYPDGRFPAPRKELIASGDATHDPGAELKERAQQGGNFTDGSSPGTYSLRLRPDLRAIAKAHDPANALIASALAHDRGDDVTANAMADLAVTGRNAYSTLLRNPPNDSDLNSRLTGLLPSGQIQGPQYPEYVRCVAMDKLRVTLPEAESECRSKFPNALKLVPPDPARVKADVQFAKNRALQVAWALRNPNTQKAFHDRSTLRPAWIAVSAEDDPPDRPVNVPSGIPTFEPNGKTQIGYYPQFDLPVTVALSYPGAKSCNTPTHAESVLAPNPCTVTFVTRYTIASGPRLHLPGEHATSLGGGPAAVNAGTAASTSAHSRANAAAANSGAPAVPTATFSLAGSPARLLSASACLTNDGVTCLPETTSAPAVGHPRRAIVTVMSGGKPASGVQVSVPSQGVIEQTDARGTAIIRYAGCFEMAVAPNGVPKARPCQATVRKPEFAPDVINVP